MFLLIRGHLLVKYARCLVAAERHTARYKFDRLPQGIANFSPPAILRPLLEAGLKAERSLVLTTPRGVDGNELTEKKVRLNVTLG